MRSWNKMMAGGAAMLMSVGSAHAVEQVRARGASAPQDSIQEKAPGERPDAAARQSPFAAKGDGSGFVTRDELEKVTRASIERLQREQDERVPAPTFTDAG